MLINLCFQRASSAVRLASTWDYSGTFRHLSVPNEGYLQNNIAPPTIVSDYRIYWPTPSLCKHCRETALCLLCLCPICQVTSARHGLEYGTTVRLS